VATLLTHDASVTTRHALTSPSLRTWLAEDWAILFSHPNDFVSCDLEMDRWLVIARGAFSDRRVRPIALGTAATRDQSWVTQLTGDERAVLLEDPRQHHFGPVDVQAPVLHQEIEQAGRRFVLIIDNLLRVHKTFSYEQVSSLPSPLELLGWAHALRAKQAARQTAVTENGGAGRQLPSREVPLFAARRHKHRVPQPACTLIPRARAI
jgi:alkyl hydroperoxide reductase subunit AhpC